MLEEKTSPTEKKNATLPLMAHQSAISAQQRKYGGRHAAMIRNICCFPFP